MIVRCVKDSGYLLSQRAVSLGMTQETTYEGVKINQNYNTYGIALHDGSLMYLILDGFNLPNWYPAFLFMVTDAQLPDSWFYKFFGYPDNGLWAVWGYKELVIDEAHYEGICEKEPIEIEIFFDRKSEIDRQLLEQQA